MAKPGISLPIGPGRERILLSIALTAAVFWLLITGTRATARSGFSPDEELTALVTSSSPLLGVPVLPSGVVYLRGVVYLKLTALAGSVFTRDLPTYRAVSLMFGLADVVLIGLVAWRWLGPAAAPAVAIVLAASPLHGAVSAFARPYTAAIFCLLLACLALPRAVRDVRGEWHFLAIVAVAQAVHEAAALLAFVPLAYAATSDLGDTRRRRAILLLLKTIVIVVGLQYLFGWWFSPSASNQLVTWRSVLAFSVVRSIPGPAMYVPALARVPALCVIAVSFAGLAFWLRRSVRLPWPELGLGATLATLFLLGPLLAAAILGILVQPRRVRAYFIASLAFGIVSAAAWTAHTALVTDAALSWHLAGGLIRSALGYPFDWVWLWVLRFPVAVACAVAACLTSVYTRTAERRFFPVLAWLILLTLGVLHLTEHDRYVALVMPVFLLVAALAVANAADVAGSLAKTHASPRLAPGIVGVVVLAMTGALIVEQLAYARRADTETEVVVDRIVPAYAPRTYFADVASRDCLASIPTTDLIACNDEPACRYLLGRIDAWLLTDADLRRVCAVERGGVPRGIYAGSRILEDEGTLERFISTNAGRSVTVAILYTPKFGYAEQEAVVRRLADLRRIAARTCGSAGVTFRFEGKGTPASR